MNHRATSVDSRRCAEVRGLFVTSLLLASVACGTGSVSPGVPADAGALQGDDAATPGSDSSSAPDGASAGPDSGGADSALDSAPADSAPPLDAEAGGPPLGPVYAAPNGSGTTCTLAAPCTLDGAAALVRTRNANMQGDIVVYLRGGTYRLSSTFTLGPADSGFNGHRVAYRAYPGEAPILSGAVALTGFTKFDAARNIWRAPAPSGATGRQLFVDGVRAQRARSLASPPAVTVTTQGFTTSDATYASFGNPSSIEVVQDNDWKHLRCPLQSIASAAGGSTLNVLPSCWSGNNVAVPNVGFPLNGNGLPALSGISWVENAYELLTQPGQFYLSPSDGYLYFMPRFGTDLTTADVELPVLETLVDLRGTPGHLAPQNDTDAAYTLNWGYLAGRGFGDLLDDVHYTTTSGEAATFSFTGTGLEVLGETNSDEGPFAAYVDGVLDTSKSFTQTAPARVAQQVIYSVLGLPSGPHSVKLVNATTHGEDTVIDGFVVVPEPIAPVHDLSFEGITFSYATWRLPSSVGYIDNQAGVLWDTKGHPLPTRIPAAVQIHRGARISLVGDVVSHVGGTAIDLADGTQQSSVTGCTLIDASGGGVSAGEVDDYFQTEPSLMTSGDSVANNAIAHVGQDYHDAVGVWVGYSRGLTIDHNDIGHTPYSGMSLGWGWGWASSCALQTKQGLASCRHGTIYAGANVISNNYVHDVMGFLFDGGPIYTNGGQGSGDGSATSTFVGNFVTGGNHTNHMLYQDEGSSYWSTHDNVTSLGGGDWIGMWTPTIHDITVGPVNYTDNAAALNSGTSITFTPATVVTGGGWPAPALTVMSAAGLPVVQRPTQGLLDDDDQALAYTGSWVTSGSRGFGDVEDNVHYTQTNGDSVQLAFTGTEVLFLGEKIADQGQVEWFMDGVSQGMADTSLPAGAPRSVQQVLFTSTTLAAGGHTLRIVKRSGTYMTVDAFRVIP